MTHRLVSYNNQTRYTTVRIHNIPCTFKLGMTSVKGLLLENLSQAVNYYETVVKDMTDAANYREDMSGLKSLKLYAS